MRSRMDDGALGDDHDAVLHHPVALIHFDAAREGFDDHVFANAGIFIDDGAFDIAVAANPQREPALPGCSSGS
jgi:hypothetical protein